MKKEHQTYIALAIGLVLFLFLYFNFFLRPVNKNISEKRKRSEELTNTINNAKREAADLENLKVRNQILQIEVSQLQEKLPKSREIPDLLRTVTKDAQKFGIRILNFSQGSITKLQEYNEMRFDLNITGNFHSLAHFISEIGQEQRLLSVRNVVLNNQTGTDKSITVGGNFSLIAYLAKER